jgi:hypothetical protein
MLEVSDGADLDETLEAFARIPPSLYHLLGADQLPICEIAIIKGGRT